MAARTKRTELDKEWRSRIQTSMIMKRLQDHVAGKAKMASTQVRAAEILLRKCIPDLSATTIGGDPDNPLTIESTDALGAILQRPALAVREDGAAGEDGETLQ